MRLHPAAFSCALFFSMTAHAVTFVNWESPQVHPLDVTPDRNRLLAANTADNRLEVFDITGGYPVHLGSVSVGLDPVSVRARTNTEAWVVNHVSDSISIVDLPTLRVMQTLTPGDEPTDVVFAGSSSRAFVCVSQMNEVKVYDPANLAAAPSTLPIAGEDPRSLATDGTRVYAAIFESGNRSTILSQFEVSAPNSPYGGQNPPPNSGAGFNPPIAPGLPVPPAVGLIVKKDAGGAWRDDNNHDWSSFVTWDLHDHDVAIIDADSLATSYATGLMNLCMGIAIHSTGQVTVVGTEAFNEIRFEPNLKGKFARVHMARFDPLAPANPAISDLNPHLTYAAPSIPMPQRTQSIGDPRGIIWEAAGGRGFVSGMGSNNIIAIGASGVRLNRVDVGKGPTGLALDESRNRLYVLNRFDATISIIDTTQVSELGRVPLFDPTPIVIRLGRPHLVETHKSSGLGHLACATCHPDSRMDQIAWDLGDPMGQVKILNQTCASFPVNSPCGNWHPMKGPLVTQMLGGTGNAQPLHWRGDRENLAAFNPTFVDLQAADQQLTNAEMTEFSNYLATIRIPPNPYRNFDGSLKTSFPNGGNPSAGPSAANRCSTCHFPGQGFNQLIIPPPFRGDSQAFNTAHMRLAHEKVGFDKTRTDNSRGFGFLHDGHTDTLMNLMLHPVFSSGGASPTFSDGPAGDQQRLDVEAFMLSAFPTVGDTHPSIGVQTTLVDAGSVPPQQFLLLNNMMVLVDSFTFPVMGLIVKGHRGGIPRGFYYVGDGNFQSDRAAEILTTSQLFNSAIPGSELTFTMVPDESRIRIGVDRDEDGYFDRDELDQCSDPADGSSIPGAIGGDIDGDGDKDAADIDTFAAVLLGIDNDPSHAAKCDQTCDGQANARDVSGFVRSCLMP